MEQNLKKINPTFYMGSGKIEELRDLIEEMNAEIIVFNNELSASQIKNIEEEVKCSIIDRTALILDIFANRAKQDLSSFIIFIECRKVWYFFCQRIT